MQFVKDHEGGGSSRHSGKNWCVFEKEKNEMNINCSLLCATGDCSVVFFFFFLLFYEKIGQHFYHPFKKCKGDLWRKINGQSERGHVDYRWS